MFKRAIFDISHGGVAIILPKSEKVSVSKGKEYPVILLEVDNRKMKLKAECTHSCSIDRFKMDSLPYGGYKISFRFKEMTKEDKTFLSEYIINELLLQNLIKTAN
jgi:c-di-GMP-binding flagellar brake protein YcgR